MRRLLLLASLAAGLSATQAQTPLLLAAAPASLASVRYSAADTVRAVRHLFQHRNKGTAGTLGAGGAIVGQGATKLLVRADTTVAKHRHEAGPDILVGSALIGAGVLRTQRFGPERYAQVVTAYEQGQPLPDYVRRRLKPKYFRYREF